MADTTTTGLIAAVRRRGMLPTSDDALTDDDIITIANEEVLTYIAPLLLDASEEYLVTSEDVAVTAGQREVPIPVNALGRKVRDVLLKTGTQYESLQRIEPERESHYEAQGDVAGFMLEGNNLVLVPTPATAQSLRVKFYRRPAEFDATTGTPFPDDIPVELFTLLVQRVVVRCLEAVGDPKFQAAELACDKVRANALTLLTPRAEGTGRVVINTNGPGWRRRVRTFRR